jgi:CRISPR-associated endonuclease/helicase Cas3
VGAINIKRTETLNACQNQSIEKPGYFTLTVPTGGGKTLASMAFALNHAVVNGMKRIIYVIPFTSIIEQNAAVFKECLGEENVLEHHSNFDWEGLRRYENIKYPDNLTNSVFQKLRLATENWDIPIVVTTNVQFFESIFSNKKSNCRKLHNLAKSVIIFDEAQMLPKEYLKPCMFAVQELVQNYGTSVVFCTATQPELKRFLPDTPEFIELAPNPRELFTSYRRTQVKNRGKLTDSELLEEINAHLQTLCIVNTRKHAKGLFDGLLDDGRFHLSTLMCPAHRAQTLRTIREQLSNGKNCRVVSTQVMEAGIDLDFPVGYRALAGLDSIIQAAGRINREGKQSYGQLFIFEPESNFIKRTPTYIQQTADVARSILRDYDDKLDSIDAIKDYFRLLYTLQDEKRAFDAHEILTHFDKSDGFDFKTAAAKFKLIERNTVSITIPYNEEAIEFIKELKNTEYAALILRKLQPYTVNIYEQEYQAINEKGAIEVIKDAYAVLTNMSYYEVQSGIALLPSDGGEAVFFD